MSVWKIWSVSASMCAVLVGGCLTGWCCPSPAQAQEGSELQCALSPQQLDARRALIATVVNEALVGWSPAPSGVTLKIKGSAVLDVLRLVGLERQCCAGVGATLRWPADSPHAWVTVTGPEAFQKEVASMLVRAPKLPPQ